MYCSPPGSSVPGILQARILEWVPCPSPGDLANQGIELGSPAFQADSLLSASPGKPSFLHQFTCSVVSNWLRPHGLQHARLPCSPPTPGTCSNLSIKSVIPSDHLILCRPFLLPPSIFPSVRVFSNESVLHIRWPKYWSFSFSIHPSNEYSGLISLRIDLFNLLADSLGLSRVFSNTTV